MANFVYKIGKGCSFFYFKTFHQAQASGVENIPKDGPFILACNHVSFFDPFLAGCFLDRPIHFFARKTLFKNGLSRWLLENFQAIPVDRDEGKDPSALKKVLKLLHAKNSVLLFPEGTRSPDGKQQKAQRGIGLLACRSGVPVIPVKIFGGLEAWGKHLKRPKLFTPLAVVYGAALNAEIYDPNPEDPQRYQIAADIITHKIYAIKRDPR